jgi:hypothetical protein
MELQRNRRTATLLVALLLLVPASSAGALERDQRVALASGGTVEAEIDFGEGLRPDRGFVAFATHPADEVRVVVDTDGWGSWNVEAHLEPLGGRVRLDLRVDGATTWMFGGPQLRVHVWVPEEARVEVRSQGGDVRIDDLVGRVRARVRDADIEVRGVDGPVKLRVVGGDTTLDEIRGPVEVTTSEGDIHASWIKGPVEARTNDGSIHLEHVSGSITAKSLDGSVELSEVEGPVDARSEDGTVSASFTHATGGSLETGAGTVSVTLPEGGGAALDAHATRGDVELASSLAWEGERSDGHAVGTLGVGGPRLVLRSSRGEIRVSGR